MPSPKPKPRPKFTGKRLGNAVRARMKGLDRSHKKIKRLVGIGTGVTAAFDPHIGIPIAAAGIGFALHESLGRSALRKKLLKKPRAAGQMAKKFKGTEHESFFAKIAEDAKRKAAHAKVKKVAKKIVNLKTGKEIRRDTRVYRVDQLPPPVRRKTHRSKRKPAALKGKTTSSA